MKAPATGAVLDDPVQRDTGPSADPGPPGSSPRSALEMLLNADLDVADRDSVAALIRRSRDLRSWLDAFDVRCVRRTKALADQGRSESAESIIGSDGNRSSRDARLTRLRAETCDLFALFEQALSAGEVSAGHIDVLGLAIRDLTEDQRFGLIDREERLVDAARRLPVDDFARHARAQVADVVAQIARSSATSPDGAGSNCDEPIRPAGPEIGDGFGDGDAGTARPAPSIPSTSPVLDPQVIEYQRQRANSKLRRWRDVETGMCMTMLALDPIRDGMLKKAFDAHLNRVRATGTSSGTPWAEVELDAFMNLVAASVTSHHRGRSHDAATGAQGATAPAPTTATELAAMRTAVHAAEVEAAAANSAMNVPEICAVASWDRVLNDACTSGLCETSDGQSIAPASLRRMLCDAMVYPAILGGDGQVLDAGRSTRTVAPGQRRALLAMHRTCGHPGCRVPFGSCRVHHVRWWTRDLGATDVENLLPLCETHHHLVHEGGWTLTMTPDRIATWIRPDGTTWTTGSTADRALDVLELDVDVRRSSQPGGRPGG